GDTRGVLGIPADDISTVRQWMARVHPDDRIRLKGLRQLFTGGEIAHVSLEYRFRRDDCQYTTLGVNGYLVESPGGAMEAGPRVIGFVRTSRRRSRRRRTSAGWKRSSSRRRRW